MCQTEILFPIHERENSISNENHLKENQIRFSNQCRQIFNLMFNDNQLTSYEAMVHHCIGHLARRIKDLKENGVSISEKWDEQKNTKIKVWFFSESDKNENQKFIKGF